MRVERGSRPRATARPHREDLCEHVLYPVGGVVRPLETTGPNKPSRSHVTVPIACLSKAFGLVRTVHRSTDGSGDPAPSHTPAAPKCHEDGCPHADSDADSFVSTAARDDPAGVGLVQVPVHYSTLVHHTHYATLCGLCPSAPPLDAHIPGAMSIGALHYVLIH